MKRSKSLDRVKLDALEQDSNSEKPIINQEVSPKVIEVKPATTKTKRRVTDLLPLVDLKNLYSKRLLTEIEGNNAKSYDP